MKNVGTAEGPTRGQVARLILELGPSTAATLGGRLGLTPAAIRRHLDNLLAEGLIETRTARTYGNRGRGRPAKVFVITDAGRSAFEHAYDDLASSALRFLAETAGPDAIAEFARRQVSDLERRYAPAMARGDLPGRVQALAEALSADGYAASAGPAPAIGGWVQAEGGEQLCQHHCPVAHVAAVDGPSSRISRATCPRVGAAAEDLLAAPAFFTTSLCRKWLGSRKFSQHHRDLNHARQVLQT